MKTFLQFWTEGVEESLVHYQNLLAKLHATEVGARTIADWFEELRNRDRNSAVMSSLSPFGVAVWADYRSQLPLTSDADNYMNRARLFKAILARHLTAKIYKLRQSKVTANQNNPGIDIEL
jgi:hypothetical protein